MTTGLRAATMKTQSVKRAPVVSISKKQLQNDQLQQWLHQVATNRDRAAFSHLFKHFSPLLKSFAYANPFGSSPQHFAEDLIQEVMVKIWRKAENYNGSHAGVSTWVFTIARNTRIDMIRKASRHEFLLDSDEIFDIEDDSKLELFEQVAQKQYEKDVKKYLSELSSEQAQIVRKVYIEGKTHSQIANELSIPLGTVKSRVRLALGKLKVMAVAQ